MTTSGAFLAGSLGFTDIPRLIERVLDETPAGTLGWETLQEIEGWARVRAAELVRTGVRA